MSSLENKIIVVTGGGRGIGKEIADSLAAQGAKICLMARSEKELSQTQKEIEKKYDRPVITFSGDVSNGTHIQKAFSFFSQQGPFHGLVAAAGIYGEIGPFEKCNIDEWEVALKVNLIGTARSVHAAIPYMSSGGRIILFSGGGQGAMPNFSAYVTSKGGILRFTETVGAELAQKNIFMNAIAPGAVNTKFLDDLLEAGPEKVGQEAYQKALQQKQKGGQSPEKASELVSWLMSSASAGLYGKTISAIWDDYKSWGDLVRISQSDIFAFRRVIDSEGKTRN